MKLAGRGVGFSGVEVDLSSEVSQKLGVLPQLNERIAKAVAIALKKSARWLSVHSSKEVARQLSIKQKPIKDRFFISNKNNQVSLWVGLLSVSAHEIGRVTQNRAGARVAKRQYDGAFFSSIYGNEERIYIRAKRNETAGHDVLRTTRRRTKKHRESFMGGQDSRFPVQVVGLPFADEAEPVLEHFERRLNRRFLEILEQEVRFAIQEMQ